MNNIVNYEQVKGKIITIREQQVILDSDVAELYGVETKRINEAVGNNPEKFPEGYVFVIDNQEQKELVENFDRFNRLKHSTVENKAFTEKGLYMLATILKSPKAVQTTITIVETFAQMREFKRTIGELTKTTEKEKQQALIQKSGEIISDIIGDDMVTEGTETTFKANFAIFSLEHKVIKKHK
ncbi:MAG: ORF6N domain-containing protein [Bacteroidales bacterium]|jgi:phage regulator Rha-like protein|nr:ORF6N domain-containing protein [Bacteroidales bacterium]